MIKSVHFRKFVGSYRKQPISTIYRDKGALRKSMVLRTDLDALPMGVKKVCRQQEHKYVV